MAPSRVVALIGPVVLSARFVVRPRTRQSACPRRRSPVGALRGARADVLDAIQYGVGQPREDGDADASLHEPGQVLFGNVVA